jgi:sugar phosphate isomerase/epimerase
MHKTDAEIEFHRILGCDYVAIGGYWGHGQTLEAYQKFLAEAKPVVPALNAAGLTFAYHNHSHEFIRIRETGQWLIDYVFEQNPAIEFEMDTYWVANAGVDVVHMINRLPGRLTCVHLKDQEMVPDVGGVMAPVGEGNLNWDGILPALDQAGTKWFIVEQDDCRRDPFDCLASSFDYLSQLTG